MGDKCKLRSVNVSLSPGTSSARCGVYFLRPIWQLCKPRCHVWARACLFLAAGLPSVPLPCLRLRTRPLLRGLRLVPQNATALFMLQAEDCALEQSDVAETNSRRTFASLTSQAIAT